MGITGITCGAESSIGEAVAELRERFDEALGEFGPGCDADAVARQAEDVEDEAREAADAIVELKGFLDNYLADVNGLQEKAERLKDDAQARDHGPDSGPAPETDGEED